MPIPESFIQEVKDRNSITDVVSSYVNLKRRGRNMIGLCPFHGEKTPSFTVYVENGSFYCFGCGVGGDVVNFIMRIENLDYVEAIRFLAQRAGLNMPEDNTYDNSLSELKKRIYEINRETARYFHKCLYSPLGEQGLKYLHSRGLTDKTITHFGLGFAPDGRFNLVNHLKSKGYKDSDIIAANLAYKNKNNNGSSDRFYNRVMFPIIDVRGNVIAFGGRIMTDQKPKYLNTSDTVVFKKSHNLFSLNNAKNTPERELILCEGYMDVIAVNQAGFQNAVATLGTALTPDQAVLMKRYADEVIICYDADEAGQKATTRAIDILRKTGINIRVLTVPQGKDPDEFIRNNGKDGAAAFKSLIKGSGNDIEYRISKIRNKHNITQTEGKVAYMKEVLSVLSTIEDPIEQELYCTKISGEVGVQKETVVDQLKRMNKRKAYSYRKNEIRNLQTNLSGTNDKVNTQHREKQRGVRAEELLIGYLISNPDKASYISQRVTPDKMITDFNRVVYSYFIVKILSDHEPLATISADFTNDEVSKIYHIINSFLREASTNEALEEYINTILDEKNKLSAQDIANASTDDITKYLSSLKNKHKRKETE